MMTLRRTIQKMKNPLLHFIRTKENSVFGVSSIYIIELCTHLRLNFSNLNEHKRRIFNFSNMMYPMCNYGADITITIYYYLLCKLFQKKLNVNSMLIFVETASRRWSAGCPR